MHAVFGAVDLGASSGRVVAGWLAEGRLRFEVVHRFANRAVDRDGHLRWSLTGLYEEVLVGLAALHQRHGDVASLGVDTWAVDYGLLDDGGALLAEPVAYRDGRTEAVLGEVHRRVSPERLYAINGLQFLPFTTLYQLTVEQRGPLWNRARHAVLLPDLLAYWLTGQLRTEVTNASTTGLLDARTRTWSAELQRALDVPSDLFPPLVEPGQPMGTLRPDVASRTGLSERTPVVAVGSHDTASAVVGVPADGRRFSYVSSGTWSLVGVELDSPVLSEESRRANFTNEGGVDRRIRYLHNVGGLWLLQESLQAWREAGQPTDQDELLAAAARLEPGPVVDVDAAEFLPPGDMPGRIREACRAAGEPLAESAVAVVRCIVDSLAVSYARTVSSAARLSGQPADVVHVVGGGSQNADLCQRTADLSGRTVLAGPVEATALGNLAVQARAAGLLPVSLEELRAELRSGLDLQCYRPRRGAVPVAEGA